MEATIETTLEATGGVVITAEEYRELVSSQTMLDMILASADGSHYPDSAIVKQACALRRLHTMHCLVVPVVEDGEPLTF